MDIESTVKGTNVLGCLECGKCTANCPISRFNGNFSPRLNLSLFFQADPNVFLKDDRLWLCLTCGMCKTRCPADVDYSEFTKRLRFDAFDQGKEGKCTHGGALQALMRIQTSPNLEQNRLEWVPEDLKISKKGDTLYFVGCLPYFDAFFTDLNMDTLASAKGVIKTLNRLDIEPVLLKNERCCGHDMLWSGDLNNFKKLAKHNLTEIEKSGAKNVVFSCAEGYRTFKIDYPKHFGQLPFEVTHFTELVAQELTNGRMKLEALDQVVTYQDPCRLGRHLGVYNEPRTVLNSVPKLQFVEMTKNNQNAMCCGTSAWMNCDMHSKQIQTARLQSAKQTGADLLVTACPKCAIHFSCAMQGDAFPDNDRIEIKDMATLMGEMLA